MGDPTKLVGLNVRETSGVDHPAHLREGWLVMKQAGATEGPRSVPGRLITKEEPVGDTLADVTKERDNLATRVTELEKALRIAKGEEQGPSEDEIIKAAPPAVRELLEKARAAQAEAVAKAAAAEAVVAKALEDKADAEATAAAEVYKSLGMKPDEVGPALRRLEVADPTLAKSVRQALDASLAQLKTSDLFKSVGTSVADTTAAASAAGAYGQMVELAKAKVAAGVVKSVEAGVALVAQERTDLYAEYLNESKGR